MTDRLRVTICPKGALTGIVVPGIDVAPGYGPFYVFLTQSEIEKGWEEGLLSCIAYYEASARDVMAFDGEYCNKLKAAIAYLYELYAIALFHRSEDEIIKVS